MQLIVERRLWGLVRLFECIGAARGGEMKKGSPRDYDAETGCIEQLAQKSQLGEPHECYPLYRIGRTQENRQLLHKDCRRPDRSGGQIAGFPVSASKLGGRLAGAMVWGDGSHAVQCLDLRHVEAIRATSGDGSSGQDEGHHCRQKEERYDRCTHHRGPASLRFVADLLCVAAGNARSEAVAALSQYGGPAVGTDAKQDGRSADGERHHLRQRQAAREEILLRADGEPGRGTRVGQGPAADESRIDGDVRVDPETDRKEAGFREGLTTARRTPEEHPRSRFHHCIDLGVGGIGPTSLFLDWRCSQLLWLNCGVSIIGRQRATWPNLQTEKRLATDCSDRSGQAGAALESAVGRTAYQAIRTGSSQSGDLASGAKASGLSAGCGQKRSTLPGSESAANRRKLHEDKKAEASLYRQSRLAAYLPSLRSVSDPPAAPRVFGDCARELLLPIHPIVCFEVGRFALTQSSRPTLIQRCSRKWMSGPAAYALVLLEDPGQLVTEKLYPSGEHLPPGRGESPLPLDCYLSWMSPPQPQKSALSWTWRLPWNPY